MVRFSQRRGIVPVREAIQVESIDEPLRNGLWNCVLLFLFEFPDRYRSRLDTIHLAIWMDYLDRPIDEVPGEINDFRKIIRKLYYDSPWYWVYDLIEFIAQHLDDSSSVEFANYCNHVLTKHVSAYRLVSGNVVPITDDEQIKAIEQASDPAGSLAGVRSHLAQSLALLSDREAPDYRNSIKESISAVETLCNRIANKPNGTLGEALKLIEKQGRVDLHPALKGGFERIYGFTNDASGIRHALKDESSLDIEDAIFMLVACSAFINYLVQKVSKAGITL